MEVSKDIQEYVQSLKASKRLGGQVVFHKILPEEQPTWGEPAEAWPGSIEQMLQQANIRGLFSHQAQAIDFMRSGKNVIVVTPTASGKTLIYNLMIMERFFARPDSKALYMFPLKALAQDQLLNLNKFTASLEGRRPTAAIYDGDTSAWHRKRIREKPPNVIMTNPEMLHLSFLPHHARWASFFSGLETVVIDEVHTYRGLLGSHMSQVFRRLQRICKYYHSSPAFIFNSATVANPKQLAQQLTDLEIHTVHKSGSPKGKRHIIFVDPIDSPAQTAILLLKAALKRNLRTIVYTQSRKMTELIAIWAATQAGEYADRISAYRAGFLPEERREIEAKLSRGELLAVISTSALELGIDIGDLDLCLLVGYPGTIVSTWQREGRVGRSGQESAMILIAGEDALDQYFMRNPEDFLQRSPEAAVVNPFNPNILARHVVCAANELPLLKNEDYLQTEEVVAAVSTLETSGELLQSGEGGQWFSSRKAPHRQVHLRGAGDQYAIIGSSDSENKGAIDGLRVFKETHPGAVYLHKGDTYLVDTLDIETNTVRVTQSAVDYYTRVRAHKNTEILAIYHEKQVAGTRVFTGKLKVTEQVTGFERWRIRGRKFMNRVPLDLPEYTFETDGIWFEISTLVQTETESQYLHFMGGIHAMEHAAIGMFPLIVMTDRNDLGGISIPYHPQVGSAAVFIYDGIPGGAGLCRQAFHRAKDLLDVTLRSIQTCPCETGCPSCVHSPKCGSGNRPIDKASAIFILKVLLQMPVDSAATPDRFAAGGTQLPSNSRPDHRPTNPPDIRKDMAVGPPMQKPAFQALEPNGVHEGHSGNGKDDDTRESEPAVPLSPKKRSNNDGTNLIRLGVFDLETQRSAQEVGGWHRADLMKVSCAVLYDSAEQVYHEYLEKDMPRFIEHLQQYDCVVGFNIRRFDYKVLSGYSDFDFDTLPTLDLLEKIHKQLGYRLSLDHLAKVNLGSKKSADGLQALRWWKQGKIREIIDYCRQDVRITWEIYCYGNDNGYLLFQNKAGTTVRVPVGW
jgi:DEAD/DEAH box helicase domain-containing protein